MRMTTEAFGEASDNIFQALQILLLRRNERDLYILRRDRITFVCLKSADFENWPAERRQQSRKIKLCQECSIFGE